MRKTFATLAFSALILGSAAAAHAQVSIGVRIGPPPPPRAYVVPARPTPNHEWMEGHYVVEGKHYRWHDGQWVHPPRQGAYWQEPYYWNGHYYTGHWEGGETHTRANHERSR